jgi:cation diffusion facilitator family transporter
MNDERRFQDAMRVTFVGIAGNLILVVVKFIAGILGRSSAIIADAVHSLSDFASDIIVIAGLRLARRPADECHKYGHGKFETLSAMLLGFVLLATAGGIMWSGVNKLTAYLNGDILTKPGWIAVYAALLSIVVKEWLYRYTVKTGKKINSQSLIANAVHHRSDALSSIAAMGGIGGAILLGEKWRVLDPAAAMIVGLLIVWAAVNILKETIGELLEKSLGMEEENRILELARQVEGAMNPHNLKTRKIGSQVAIDLHIHVEPTLTIPEAHDISTLVENRVKDHYGADSIVYVHIEPSS